VASNIRFQNPSEEIGGEAVDVKDFLVDVIIWRLLFPARKGFGLPIVKFRKMRAEDQSVVRICGKPSVQETGLDIMNPEELLSVKT
jgi:hypothetical protein